MEEPPPPKKQKTEGAVPEPHDDQQAGAAEEPPPPVPPSSALSLGDPSLPCSVIGPDPNGKYYNEIMKFVTDGSESSPSPPDNEEMMRRDSANVAGAALELYNTKEHTEYVFDEPFLCRCMLIHPAVVLHANFTAKEPNSSGSSELFFAEAVQYLKGGSRILNCVKVDPFAKGGVRNGCIYCREDIIHPPVEHCKYGVNQMDDHNDLQYKKANTKPSNEED